MQGIYYYYLPYLDTGLGACPLVVSYDGISGAAEIYKQVDITGVGNYVWVPEALEVDIVTWAAKPLRKEVKDGEVFFIDLSTGREFWYDRSRRGIVMAEWYEDVIQSGVQLGTQVASQAVAMMGGAGVSYGGVSYDDAGFMKYMVPILQPHAIQSAAPAFCFWFGEVVGTDSTGNIISLGTAISKEQALSIVQAYANEVGRADLYGDNLSSETGYRGGAWSICMGSGEYTGRSMATVVGNTQGATRAAPIVATDYTVSGEPAQAGMTASALPWVLAGGMVLLLYSMGRPRRGSK